METPLLTEIDKFLERSGMAESTLGQKAIREWRVVQRLRDGGDVTTRTAQRLREFMKNWEPAPDGPPPRRRGSGRPSGRAAA